MHDQSSMMQSFELKCIAILKAVKIQLKNYKKTYNLCDALEDLNTHEGQVNEIAGQLQ